MNINITDGAISTTGIIHFASIPSPNAVIMVSGPGGGVFGPSGIYPILAKKLAFTANITALVLDYRVPNKLDACRDDVEAAISHLVENHKISNIALIGWSFGGAVVIHVGAVNSYVKAVSTIACQTVGTDLVGTLAPKPLMLFHGTSDNIISNKCSRILYQRANDPKAIVLYPNDDHALTANSKNLTEKLIEWAVDVLKPKSI